MQASTLNSVRLAKPVLASFGSLWLLGGCISSPFPGGTVGSLYQWDDLETPVVTTVGADSSAHDGFFDGDFDLGDLPYTHPELSSQPDQPWLFEACHEDQCRSMVLFSNDFEIDPLGMLKGTVSMNALTTLMANEVRGRPATIVRSQLDGFAGTLRLDGKTDYAALITLDLRRDEESRDALLYPDLFEEAVALLQAQATATISDLLGETVTQTRDLAAPADFAFDSSWQLQVDVDLPRWRNEGAYLLLCSEFHTEGEGITVNYASCPLKTPMPSGRWQGEVQLTGSIQSLAAVIMPLNNPNEPVISLWERRFDGNRLVLRP